MSEYDSYVSPLSRRYASREMQYLFSQEKKFRTWRRLWVALAETEKELGLNITDEQIAELKAHQDEINYKDAEARERIVRHDVMSHVYAYEQAGGGDRPAGKIRGCVQGSSDPCLYALPAGAADDSGQAGNSLDQ